MKRLFALLLMIVGLTFGIHAEKVTLKDVANGTYRAKNIYGLRPMLDGEHYTQISADKKRIVKYSFKTGKEVGTVFDVTTSRQKQSLSTDARLLLNIIFTMLRTTR